ncbi:MAG: YdbL family protein [Desulfobacterales bacterium]
MKQRTLTRILAFLMIGFWVLGVSAFADDIKARMKNRLPVIKELKSQGIVGEDNAGFLQFVGDKKVSAEVVAAENKDRLTVYKAIAKQQGTTAELVGKRRALQISKRAESGEWVQDAGGNWVQKE